LQEVARALDPPELGLGGVEGRGGEKEREGQPERHESSGKPGRRGAGVSHRSTVRVSVREPVTAYSTGSSKSQTVAVRMGTTFEPCSAAPSTERTEEGSEGSSPPETVARSTGRMSRA